MSDNRKQTNRVSRREALKRLSGLGLGSLFAPQLLGSSLVRDQHPNIIFVMTDDHATHSLSCYGSNVNQTPHLDRIATEGMRFDNCYVTNSLCAPSRATILTGKYGHKNKMTRNYYGDQKPFDNAQQTVPKLMREGGYQTGMIGKWHLGSTPTGFDFWSIMDERRGQGTYFDPVFNEMGNLKTYNGYTTDIITDMTMDAIVNRFAGSQPFFVMMHHKAPHVPWRADAEHKDLYEGYDLPEPETLFDDYDNRATPITHTSLNIEDRLSGAPDSLSHREKIKWKYQDSAKGYLKTIASVDDNMGRFLNFLDEQGLAGNTIVIYTSDNGYFLGHHGMLDKRFMYEESLRVPLLVRYPQAIPAGTVSDEMVMNLDFAQTFLDYAGLPEPSDMQGRSIKPLLNGREDINWRDSIYYHYYEYDAGFNTRPHYGVKTHRYKLIYYYPFREFSGEWELFDLEEDPHEMYNAYGDEEYADVQHSLKKELKRLRRYYEDNSGQDFDLPTSLEEYETIKHYKLNQNHPNPFNPTTNITVDMKWAAQVQLMVYDTAGNKIRELHSGNLSAGRHSFSFDGTELSSGIYYYRLRTKGITQVKKMILLK